MLKKVFYFIVQWGFILFPLLYLAVRVPLHTGYKEGYGSYFVDAAFISLFIVTFTTKSFNIHIAKSTLGLFTIVLLTTLFWEYMDHPWFAGPETNTCDGPCFGWFSFENFDPSIFIFLGGIVIMLITGLLKTIVFFLRDKLHKRVKTSHKNLN